jgi:Glycosyltransferase family 87
VSFLSPYREKAARAVCLASLAVCFWQGLSRASAAMDLRGYLAQGAVWMEGKNPYLPSDPAAMAPFGVTDQWGFGPMLPHGFPLFGLLAGLGCSAAAITLWILSFAAFGVSMFLLVKWLGREWTQTEAWLFVAVLAQSRLIQSVAYRGQWGLILLLPLLLAVWLEQRRHPVAAGVCLAVTLIKPTTALPLIGLFVLRRAWVALGTGAGLTTAASLAAARRGGVREVLSSYPEAVHRFVLRDREHWGGSWHVTSWQAIVYDAFGTATGASAIAGVCLLAVAGGAVGWLAWKSRGREGTWTFAALLLLAQFGAYRRVYDGVFVFVIAALLWSRVRRWPERTPTAPELGAVLLTLLFLFVLAVQPLSTRLAAALAAIPTAAALNAWVTVLLLACVVLVGLQEASIGVRDLRPQTLIDS